MLKVHFRKRQRHFWRDIQIFFEERLGSFQKYLFLSHSKKKYMNLPADLKYTNEHEWVRMDGDFAYVGVTDFAQGELGDIVYVDINSVGSTFAQGEVFGTVEAVKTVSDLYMPISGEISEVNPELNNSPELVNQDPYGKGWMVKVKLSDASQVVGLLDADAYFALIK